MASGTWQVYGLAMEKLLEGSIDLDGNPNLQMFFTDATHVPNVDTHDFENDLTNIVSGTNLPVGGLDIAGATVSYNTSTNTVMFDINDISQSNVTATGIRNAHIVDQTPGAAASNPLIAYCTFDSDLSPNAGTLSILINASGVFTIPV